jgi:N-methylhydantoinase A
VRDTTTGAVSPWRIYERAVLVPNATIVGPAIVAEDETSALIGPGWTATVNRLGYIEMRCDGD